MNISVHATLSHKLFLVVTCTVLVFALACTPVSFSFSLQRVDAKATNKTTKTNDKKTTKKKVATHISAKAAAKAKAAKIAAVKNKKNSTPTNSGGVPADAGAAMAYSMLQVATANIETKCWTAVDGNVYDITQWMSKQPGSQESVLSICGVDSTKAFESEYAGQGSPEKILAPYKIGTLINPTKKAAL